VLFVDVDQEGILRQVIKDHPLLALAGLGEPTPRWVVRGQDNWHKFVKFMP
jgi:hypothetical protein